jgi:hypothetical protein
VTSGPEGGLIKKAFYVIILRNWLSVYVIGFIGDSAGSNPALGTILFSNLVSTSGLPVSGSRLGAQEQAQPPCQGHLPPPPRQ